MSLFANDNDPTASEPKAKKSQAFGPCASYIPDNAEQLFGRKIAPALMEAGFAIHMPDVDAPTKKAPKERFFDTFKAALRQYPMPVVDMIRAREMNYDVGSYAITLSQLRDMAAQTVEEYNNSPSARRGGRIRNDIINQQDDQEGRKIFVDVLRAERAISLTYQAILDRNGIMLDGLRYRHSDRVRAGLKSMRNLKGGRVRERKNNHIAIVVKVRRNPGDLSKIEFYDDIAKRWYKLPCTEPEYTYLLSASEHRIFTKRARERNDVIKNHEQRLASAARTRAEMEELVPNLKFQQRRKWANLFEDKEVRERSKRSYPKPDADGPWLDAEIGGDDRLDSGLPNDDAYSFAEGMANRGPDAPAATGSNTTEVSNHLDLEIDQEADDTGDIDFSNVPDLEDEEDTAGATFGHHADDHNVDTDEDDHD